PPIPRRVARRERVGTRRSRRPEEAVDVPAHDGSAPPKARARGPVNRLRAPGVGRAPDRTTSRGSRGVLAETTRGTTTVPGSTAAAAAARDLEADARRRRLLRGPHPRRRKPRPPPPPPARGPGARPGGLRPALADVALRPLPRADPAAQRADARVPHPLRRREPRGARRRAAAARPDGLGRRRHRALRPAPG